MIVRLLQSLVRLYKRTFSSALHSSCRFTPTCSDYALEALERHGLIIGSAFTMWRIVRCNPFTRGGLDTVPVSLHRGEKRTKQLILAGEGGVSAGPRERSARAKSLATEPIINA